MFRMHESVGSGFWFSLGAATMVCLVATIWLFSSVNVSQPRVLQAEPEPEPKPVREVFVAEPLIESTESDLVEEQPHNNDTLEPTVKGILEALRRRSARLAERSPHGRERDERNNRNITYEYRTRGYR